jgi:hypothetical protein
MAVAVSGLAGCGPGASRIQIQSYYYGTPPNTLRVGFDECVYRQDPSRDYHIVARSKMSAAAEDAAPVEELLEVHVYWRPKPSKTHDDPTSTNATLRYVVRAGKDIAVYAGTGFVYAEKPRFSANLNAAIERADWRLESRSGDMPEALGPARVTGTLIATEDLPRTVELQQGVRMALGLANASDGDESPR